MNNNQMERDKLRKEAENERIRDQNKINYLEEKHRKELFEKQKEQEIKRQKNEIEQDKNELVKIND